MATHDEFFGGKVRTEPKNSRRLSLKGREGGSVVKKERRKEPIVRERRVTVKGGEVQPHIVNRNTRQKGVPCYCSQSNKGESRSAAVG